jgi:signal transduction histidine kinase
MNFSALVKKWRDAGQLNFLGLAYWLVGLPLTIGLVILLLSNQPRLDLTPYKAQHITTWLEALPAQADFSQDYFEQFNAQPLELSQAQWAQVELPTSIELTAKPSLASNPPMARAWFKFKHQLPPTQSAAQPIALYGTRAMGGPYTIWANGELIFSSLEDWRMLWNKPIFVQIPQHLIKPDAQLEILLGLPHRTSLGYAIGSLYMGPQRDLQSNRDMRYLVQIGLPLVGMLMMGITGLFSLMLWFKRRKESAHLWLFLLAISLIACNLQFTHDIAASQTASQWFGSLVDSATSWVFLSFFIFVQRHSGSEFPKATVLLALFTAANTLLTLPVWNWEVYGLLLQHYVLLVIYGCVVAMLTWIAARSRSFENNLFCIATWLMLLAGLHDVSFMTSQQTPDSIFIFPYGAFLLFFVAESLLRHKYRLALVEIENSNEMLVHKLKAREEEVLQQQMVLRQTREQMVLQNERLRLSRDIHDGIGSTLTGTLIQLRGQETTAAEAAEQVQSCLEDIRLVMDSMEPAQADLASLLASLRARFSNAFEAAGVQAQWTIQDLEGVELRATKSPLSPARVIQEILTNCLKHAQARTVQINIQIATDVAGSKRLAIDIQDDGKGFSNEASQSGRGLSNLRQRIKELDGQLDISSKIGAGTRYALIIPVDAVNPLA